MFVFSTLSTYLQEKPMAARTDSWRYQGYSVSPWRQQVWPKLHSKSLDDSAQKEKKTCKHMGKVEKISKSIHVHCTPKSLTGFIIHVSLSQSHLHGCMRIRRKFHRSQPITTLYCPFHFQSMNTDNRYNFLSKVC